MMKKWLLTSTLAASLLLATPVANASDDSNLNDDLMTTIQLTSNFEMNTSIIDWQALPLTQRISTIKNGKIVPLVVEKAYEHSTFLANQQMIREEIATSKSYISIIIDGRTSIATFEDETIAELAIITKQTIEQLHHAEYNAGSLTLETARIAKAIRERDFIMAYTHMQTAKALQEEQILMWQTFNQNLQQIANYF